MKKILFVVSLLSSLVVVAQPNYVTGYLTVNENRNQRMLIARALNIPVGTTPALQTGQWVGFGGLYADSTGGNRGIHYYNGTGWVKLADTTYTGFSSTLTPIGSGYATGVYGTSNTKALRDSLYFVWDSVATFVRGRIDTATMFPAIRATIPASAPAASIMGDVVSTTFPGVSIPSGFSQQNGTATITYSSGLNISGGTSDSYNDNFVKSTFVSSSNNYQYTADFTIVTKPTAPLEGLVIEKLGSIRMYVTFKHFTADSGKLVMRCVNGSGAGTPFDSTGNVSMADGGTYRVTIAQSNNTIYFKIQRLVAGSVTETKDKLFTVPINTYYQLPSVGSVGVSVLGGSYTVTSLKQTNYDIVSPTVAMIGTSITHGYSPTSFENHYLPKAFDGSGNTFSNFGSSGGGFSDFLTGLVELRLAVPLNIGAEGGVNDACATLRLYASEWIDSAIAITGSASKVFWIKDFNDACKDTIFFNLVKEKGIVGINPWTHMTADMFEDGTHPNDLGNVFIAKFIKEAAPQFFGKTGSPDQTSFRGSKDVYFSGLTTGHVATYNATTGKWNNSLLSSNTSFIHNQQASPQTANMYITGNISTSAGFLGVGTQATSSAQIQTEETAANGNGILIRNNSAASGATKVLQLVVKGGTAAEGADWNNAGVVEAVPNGGLVLDAYNNTGGIKFQTVRVTRAWLNSTGFGMFTAPTHALTVNGQVRINAINNASVFDSVVVINGGVLESRLASTLVGATPTLSAVIAAGNLLSAGTTTIDNNTGSLRLNNTNYFEINNGTEAAAILRFTRTSGVNSKIQFDGAADNNMIGYISGTTMTYNVGTGSTHSININTVPKLSVSATEVTSTVPVVLKGYTVATLPTGVIGMMAYVTDALTPTYGATAVGGGAVVTPVFYDGTNWTTR